MGDPCLFCRIVAKELPCDEVADTERTYAFRDVNPAMPTHVLVIPKEHIPDAHRVRPEHAATLTELFTTAQQVADREGLPESGYRLVFNVGADAGNTVPHLHLHLLGGRTMGWPPG